MGIAKSIIIKVTNRLKKIGYEIKRSHGYQHSTAFVKAPNGAWVYISADDDFERLLVRTAEHERDFTGGTNNFVPVDLHGNNFSKALTLIDRLSNR